jgi:hypothetical protein
MAFFKTHCWQNRHPASLVDGGRRSFWQDEKLFGQPDAYWQNPAVAEEGDAFFRFFLSLGLSVYVLVSLAYIGFTFLLMSVVPRRLGLVGIFAFILGHFLGASTWLDYRWRLGVTGPIVYGIILSALTVLLAFPRPATKLEPDA